MSPRNMACDTVRPRLSSYLDGDMTGAEMQSVDRHTATCVDCAQEYRDLKRTHAMVAALGRKTAPPDLALRIQVAISRERARSRWLEAILVQWQNTVRAFMLPATAGLVSAVLFFALVVGYVTSPASVSAADDVPTMLFTPAQLTVFPNELGLASLNAESVVIETIVDANGRVTSYKVISAPAGIDRAQLTARLDNMMIFTVFKPATAFGNPTASRVVLSISSVNVRG